MQTNSDVSKCIASLRSVLEISSIFINIAFHGDANDIILGCCLTLNGLVEFVSGKTAVALEFACSELVHCKVCIGEHNWKNPLSSTCSASVQLRAASAGTIRRIEVPTLVEKSTGGTATTAIAVRQS